MGYRSVYIVVLLNVIMDVWVLRYGHRVKRDERITTHVALTARALGALGMYYSGQWDRGLERSVKRVCEQWGGQFEVKFVEDVEALLKTWQGLIVHLTMYGIPLLERVDEIRKRGEGQRLLVLVGGKKVPSYFYTYAHYNVAVTLQPHSELSALAIFLDHLFLHAPLRREFNTRFINKRLEVVPQERGKRVKVVKEARNDRVL